MELTRCKTAPSLQSYLGEYGNLTKQDAKDYREEMLKVEEEFNKRLAKKNK